MMISKPKYVLLYGIGPVYDVQCCDESLSKVRQFRRSILDKTRKDVPYLDWTDTTPLYDDRFRTTDYGKYSLIETWESNREPDKDYIEIQEWV